MNYNIPMSKTPRSRKMPKNLNIPFPKLLHDSEIKKLHFFEAGQGNLHIYNFEKGLKKTVVPLDDFTTPDFHATLLSHTGNIFTSGGILELG